MTHTNLPDPVRRKRTNRPAGGGGGDGTVENERACAGATRHGIIMGRVVTRCGFTTFRTEEIRERNNDGIMTC
jgi:hypothetical protein